MCNSRRCGLVGQIFTGVITVLSAACCVGSSTAQGRGRLPVQTGRNQITVHFTQSWQYRLDDPAKLIEIGPLTDTHKNNLVMLQLAGDITDTKRRLVVAHWDGLKFVPDSTMDFRGQPVDDLIIGKFRSSRNSPNSQSPFDRPSSSGRSPIGGRPINTNPASSAPPPVTPGLGPKSATPLPPTQIITTEGVYVWMNKGMTRLFSSPQDVHFSLVLSEQDIDDRLVAGAGDAAACYEVGENFVKETTEGAPKTGAGYVRSGGGNQAFPGAANMTLDADVRYMQSIWDGKNKYMVGLAKGSPAATTAYPTATTGDRLVLYVPKFASRSKSFWQLTRDDFEEDWRSDPLPGRVLDVRLGDPKNEGKIGILVLTSENKDQEGHLYFFQQDK